VIPPVFLATLSGLCALAGAALIASGVQSPAPIVGFPYVVVSCAPAYWPTLPNSVVRDLWASSIVVDCSRNTPAPDVVVVEYLDAWGTLVGARLPVSGATWRPTAPGRGEWTCTTPHSLIPGIPPGAALIGVERGALGSTKIAGVLP